MSDTHTPPIKVGLFVTCLADMFRPEVAFATVKLLEQAGCEVEVPSAQTCCGQPAFNSGDNHSSRKIARQTIAAFEGYQYVVGPSGSCIGMLHHYPELFADDDPWKTRAKDLKARAFEITSFLVDILAFNGIQSSFKGKITYHDSCSGLRELGIKQQPRQLLAEIDGIELNEMQEAETCCGFGGTFCVKYPDISNRMVSNKTEFAANSGAETLVGGDLGCLLNMAGKLKREGREMEVRHVVELLADMARSPAIGEASYDLGQEL
ncbi:(Fe-S)-binding protein [Marinobacterium sediminicola]|uniref:L-lactate dehydrogenase complex protein LldE n=1 Tax=Marinobacterium sediminicola TaxID=518898 RepID=A0ABY1RXY2_9GAMM|nr:(Fe-S)-binding protein [Marinobacterium sediminicola]ULG68569.1 (Fe-S)-binding protein [Marinobacterium sediminicola]SMR73087.1 L-lactate dehydrogenase complex protein LldE [Marinobacterium sediminicola]